MKQFCYLLITLLMLHTALHAPERTTLTSYDDPAGLYAKLRAIKMEQTRSPEPRSVTVFYMASTPSAERAYQRIWRAFPWIQLKKEGEPATRNPNQRQPYRTAATTRRPTEDPEQSDNATREPVPTHSTAHIPPSYDPNNLPEIEGMRKRVTKQAAVLGSRFGASMRRMFNTMFRGEDYAQQRAATK